MRRRGWRGRGALGVDISGPAIERLPEMIAGNQSGDGVWFGSRCWIVTARRQ